MQLLQGRFWKHNAQRVANLADFGFDGHAMVFVVTEDPVKSASGCRGGAGWRIE